MSPIMFNGSSMQSLGIFMKDMNKNTSMIPENIALQCSDQVLALNKQNDKHIMTTLNINPSTWLY